MTCRRLASVAMFVPAVLMLAACDPDVALPDDIGTDPDNPGDPNEVQDDDESAPEDSDGDEQGQDQDQDQDDPQGDHSDDTPSEPAPEPAIRCDPESWGGEACTDDAGQEGQSFCIMLDDEPFHTPCFTAEPECMPGDGWDMGCIGELCYWDGEQFRYYSWEEPDCNTPLVLNFDDAPVEFTSTPAAAFDLSPDGTCMSTDWPTAPWLALDRDGDGFIRDGGELFGSATAMSTGGHAPHGFAALAELDTNRDGKISAADERFGELVLWSDLDDDRIGAYSELRPLSETTLVSIDLDFGRMASCDHRGNCGYERAPFEYRTASGTVAMGEVVDVHVACR